MSSFRVYDIAKELKIKIRKSGVLILSGLLIIDEKDILEKYTQLHFKLIEKNTMDEWCALVFQL